MFMFYYCYSDFDSLYAVLGGGLLVIGILFLVFAIFAMVAIWNMYKKAGKGGWESIIPVYSYWVLVEIAGLNWWWFLLAVADSIVTTLDIDGLSRIANLVSLFASFNIYYNIAKKFGKSNGTSVCAGIFYFIFVFIFGFSKNEKYDASIPVSANGIFATPNSNAGNNNNNNNYQNNASYQDNNNGTNQSTEVVDTNIVNENDNTVKKDESKNENAKKDNQEHFYCGNCGTKLDKDVKFCPNCGKENM